MPDYGFYTLVRVVLPLSLIFASLSRPVAISMIYLILFLVSPWLSKRRAFKIFLAFAFSLSALLAIGHLAVNLIHFMLVYVKIKPSVSMILRQVGFVNFMGVRVQVYLDSCSIWVRIMGLEPIMILFQQNWNGMIFKLNDQLSVDSYLSPVALMASYFIITLNIKQNARYMIFTTIQLKVIPKPDEQSQITQESLQQTLDTEEPSLLEQFFYMICDVTTFIYKNCYILLNIIMMIWSIVYHSWLTFVLLIWANILWMIPNQRRSMMRTSFFVVMYAEFLLIAQYIYGMNLSKTELPTKIYGLNLAQIGFVHPMDSGVQPCIPLFIKTAFLCIFWITSHQYFKEKADDKKDILSQIFSPKHSRSEQPLFEKSRTPRAILFVFESVSNFVTRIWMWMLIFLIFLCAMLDQVMTGFRICYMSLFLLFLMVFHMSLHLWIKFLFGYWMFVIFYAMTILTIIYTYQFDYFDHYWEEYFHVHPKLQNDIGLRRYQTKDLCLHLLVPTLTVIFTVVQLHYFHRRFMQSVREPFSNERHKVSQVQFNNNPHKSNIRKKSWKSILSISYRKLRSKIKRWFRPSKEVAWRFLEIHMIKAVILTTFTCAISEICCFNLLLLLSSLLSVCVNRLIRRVIFRIVTFWVSVLILMKMIYQIDYLDKTTYDYTCRNNTVNFADWMGLRKADQRFGALLRYIAPYLVYMIVSTLHAVVKLRDHLIRMPMGSRRNPNILFPHTNRQDAERNFPELLKYLFNYGFFKFGLEITLIALASTIVHRRDLLALTYLVWLILLLCLSRMQSARIWYIIQLYFVLSILVQYVYIIHFPPNLCRIIPLRSHQIPENKAVEKLIGDSVKSKLMLDFIVLLLISRQRSAFQADLSQTKNYTYPGGDNRNIVNNIAKLGLVYFKNPTHDFCSFVRNYSDVFKILIFCNALWVTLAIVFMGGVCSMDMLSLGYLIFALVFLLQGSEVYLQNIHYIICRWNFLIALNVFNIIIKTSIIVFGNMLNVKDKQDYQSLFAVMEYDQTLSHRETYKLSERSGNYNYGPNSLIFNNTLIWHAIIFAFIIFQHRIFRSYYFCHIIMDTQANTILASRGAIVIENLHYKQIYDRRESEKSVLAGVKAKMERIRIANRNNYKKEHEVTPSSPTSSPTSSRSEDSLHSKSSKLKNINLTRATPSKKRNLKLHPHAVRSGDYYMFVEQEEVEDQLLEDEYDFLEKEDELTRQTIKASKSQKQLVSKRIGENSSDSEIDFDTHPIVKLTSELIMLVTLRLNRLSRNYRFVHKVLSAEKKTLQDISTMNRLGLVNTAAMFSFLNQSLYYKQLDAISDRSKLPSVSLVSRNEDFSTLDHSEFVQMLFAFWHAIIANTEAVSYLAVFVNQAANSSLISLPLPFLVLYWGALTLPRPTKSFWVTLITYTLAMIFLKCILHQKIVLDLKLTKLAKTTDFEFFVKHGKAVYDLLLLVVLFWHRYMLKKQGIWNLPRSENDAVSSNKSYRKAHNKDRPSEIVRRLREESGSDRRDIHGFKRDMDDFLRPGVENKYVYNNIESEYYRQTMQHLEHKGEPLSEIKKFFLALFHKARLSTDVYTLLFLCDFINFFVLLFGFPKFVNRHKHSASVLQTYIQGNKVPFSFFFMLVVQFGTIVAERVIYLRKALRVKIVFHFITVLGIHIWMFFLVPYVTSISFGATAPITFYLIKCLHMLLSAYQMRCGYPRRILGNVFTKSFSMVNYVAFKVYMEIPFLYILRTMLDWLCIDTTLTVMEWIKMEDIYQSVFTVRCYRQMDSDFPVLRGEPKEFYTKCLIGGTIILILVALIWSPLFLFALIGTVGKSNVPRRADISIKIGNYEPLYISQSYSGIHQFSEDEYKHLVKSFSYDTIASDHITIYDPEDVTAVKFDSNSVTLWNMSPPNLMSLLNDLKTGKPMEIRMRMSLNSGAMMNTIMYETTYKLTQNIELTREMLIRTLSDENSNVNVVVPDILPKFITIQKMEVFVKFIRDFDGNYRRPIILKKKQDEGKVWWEMHDYCDDKYYKNIISNLPLSDCDDGIVFYIFNDKSFPTTMSFLEKTGIIGLYTTCVYVVSRLIRSIIANNHRRIMFEDLPYVDRILKLCNDIYLVRENKEYRLEEDLYGKLLFLYRSPETLIKWTRYKEEFIDEPVSTTNAEKTQPDKNEQDARPPP
ncbi:piezo-type mechanosensitive ion channel component [Drosophila grimshawi]|uniref:piezo-type mechanosensitive ion channel component n=1 Tax=Drosophila grimshawi TaxID=7222 RepID=UPI001C932307|nr:piezo-type mechanosensitive ion channel component [Drosophila grimshawi]